MRIEGTADGKRNAKRLRKDMTPPEIALWLALRRNEAGLHFRRQHAAGRYVLDFYCAPARLALEVDGEAHERGDRPERDRLRDGWLAERGVRVLRYAARDVLGNPEGVVGEVMQIAMRRLEPVAVVSASSPSVMLRMPPPPGGGGS
jgi:very-short-patch-repair endonuclease